MRRVLRLFVLRASRIFALAAALCRIAFGVLATLTLLIIHFLIHSFCIGKNSMKHFFPNYTKVKNILSSPRKILQNNPHIKGLILFSRERHENQFSKELELGAAKPRKLLKSFDQNFNIG